jgi:hypothetical protein
MEKSPKFVPYDKRSKKAQAEADRKSRADWGGVNPVSKTFTSDKDYDRAQNREVIDKEMEEYERES